MHILITGGTGFIGSKLSKYYLSKGFRVSILTRDPEKIRLNSKSVSYISLLNDFNEKYDIIINLAGEPLDKNRWNEEVKKQIYDSRIQTTQKVIEYLKKSGHTTQLLITGSAIGYYGSSLTQIFDEDTSPADSNFPHQLCADWEKTGLQATQYGVRVCVIRTGIVLGKDQGALSKMLIPFKFGLGAQLGDGSQWMSWIHIDDMVEAIDFLVNHQELSGVFNLTAPEAVTNRQFTNQLAHTLNRPRFLTFPAALVKILFGEMGEDLLLKGQRVTPKKLLQTGYQFKFLSLGKALEDVLA